MKQSVNHGRFFALKWSKDWNSAQPWTLSGRKTPYIGHTVSPQNDAVSMITLGPIAVVIIHIKPPA